MKTFLLILKVVTFPVWIHFWLIAKLWRVFALVLFVGLIAGCTSTSNKFDRSPCACDFQPLNSSDHGEKKNA
jgi:preprotein translocase subunit SecF